MASTPHNILLHSNKSEKDGMGRDYRTGLNIDNALSLAIGCLASKETTRREPQRALHPAGSIEAGNPSLLCPWIGLKTPRW